MRRFVMLAPLLLLSGCVGSGFWAYVKNTETFPGQNPNRPPGDTETYKLVRHLKQPEPPPMVTEAGDVWPEPPKPVPTLKDLQKQQTAEFQGFLASKEPPGSPNLPSFPPLPPLPVLEGYTITPPDAPKSPPQMAMPSGLAQVPNGTPAPITGGQNHGFKPAPNGNGAIIVPNGNGTSTVISPNGSVSTIPTPKQ